MHLQNLNNELLEKNSLSAEEKYSNIKVKESELIIPYREAFKNLNINLYFDNIKIPKALGSSFLYDAFS